VPAREAKMVPSGAVVEVMLVSAGGVVRDSSGEVKGNVVSVAPVDGVELDGPSRGVVIGVSMYGMLSWEYFFHTEKGVDTKEGSQM